MSDLPAAGPVDGQGSPGRWPQIAFATALAAAWFFGIGSRALNEPDEGRYAEVAREMLASGDWVLPRFDGFRFFDKPPLQYWATALSYRLFGVADWTARLWSALAGLLCVAAVAYAAHRVWGPRHGRFAGLVCISLFLVAAGGHVNTLDMGVTAFLTCALASFLIAEHGGGSARSQRRWMLGTWLAMALAVLSKGLIGVVLPGAVLLLYVLWRREWRLLGRLRVLPGMLLLLLVSAPWFVLLARRDPNFLSYFFIHEHVGRFLSNVIDRDRPWWFYLPILAVGTLPWTAFLPGSLRLAWHRAVDDRDGAMQLLLAWTAFVLLFFSLSGAKLPLYVLPLFPSAAMLIACVLTELAPAAVARRLLPMAVLGLTGCAVMLVLPQTHVLEGTKSAYAALCNPLAASFAILAAGSGAGVVLARRSRVDTAIAVAAMGALLFVQGLLFAYERLAPTASAQPIAALAAPYVRDDMPVYAVTTFARGLPFYLRRTVTLADQRPYDMRMAMQWDPGLSIPDLDAFARVWKDHPAAVAIMPTRSFRTLMTKGMPMRVVATMGDNLIVRNPAIEPVQPEPSPATDR